MIFADAIVLDMTSMGDVFFELPDGEFVMVSSTDGGQTVTEEFNEFSLPPVDFLYSSGIDFNFMPEM